MFKPETSSLAPMRLFLISETSISDCKAQILFPSKSTAKFQLTSVNMDQRTHVCKVNRQWLVTHPAESEPPDTCLNTMFYFPFSNFLTNVVHKPACYKLHRLMHISALLMYRYNSANAVQ